MKKAEWNEVLNEDGTFKGNTTISISGEGLNELIIKKKKEVFNDIEKTLQNDIPALKHTKSITILWDKWKQIKKRHLSTLQKSKAT